MPRDRLGIIWAGLGLIGLGLALILAQFIGWDRFWPIFPMLGGLAFLVGYVAGGFRDPGLVFVGTAALLVGLFFFGFTLGYWEWTQMAQLWPVFPIIGGIAFLTLFLAEGQRRDVGVLGIGCAAIIVGVVGLGVTFRLMGGEILKYWPLLLIFVGIISLFGALARAPRRQ